MGGLCGIVTGDGFPPVAARMMALAGEDSWSCVERTDMAGAFLAALSSGGGRLYCLGEGADAQVAVLAGALYDYEAQRRRLEQRGCLFLTDGHAELFLQGYVLEGLGFLRQVRGAFAAAVWDGWSRTLRLMTDRFGLKPLYYARQVDGVAFGTCAAALLGQPGVRPSLNARGVGQFFAYRQLLGDDTLYEDVGLVPPGACLTFKVAQEARASSAETVEHYWELGEAFQGGGRLSRRSALEAIDTAFSNAMAQCLADAPNLGLSLSGGLDSRTLLAAVPQERRLTCVTLGGAGSIDVQLAGRLAALTGRKSHACLLNDGFLADFEQHLRRMVRLTDGHYVSSAIVMPSLETYRTLGIRTLLRGHGGELMHLDKAYGYSLPPGALDMDGATLRDRVAQRLGAALHSDVAPGLFRPAFADALAEARASLDACFDEATGIEPPTHQVAYVFVQQFLRRATAMSMLKFDTVVETRLPFVDPDLIAALMAAPPQLKLGDQVQTWLIHRHGRGHGRELLAVPNANTGARLGVGPMRRMLAYGRMRLLRHLGVRGYQPYERMGLWLREALAPVVRDVLLSEACLDRGVFAPDGVRRVIDEHVGQQRNHGQLLVAMLAFELGQQELVDRLSPAEQPLVRLRA